MKNQLLLSLLMTCTLTCVQAQSWTAHTNGTDLYFSGGKVGIGTTSPSELLHVKGTGYIHHSVGGIKFDGVTTEASNQYVRSTILSSRDGDLEWDSTNDVWTLGSTSNSNDFAAIIHRSYGQLSFYTGNASAFSSLSNSDFRDQHERLTILGNGKVGIGTTTPDQKLTVEGKIRSTDNLISNGLTIGKYGNALSGDLDPWRINSPAGSGDHDLILYGSNTGATLNMRLYDGSLKVGSGPSANAELLNDGSAYFSGSIGIGTTSPDQKLAVKGKIHAEEVIVDLSVPGPDYVFADKYNLPTLESIEAFIQSEKHLPEVPSAIEMETNGVQLGEMNMLLLKKIEELTLYTLQQEREIQNLKARSNSPLTPLLEEKGEETSGLRGELETKIEELILYMNELRHENAELKMNQSRILETLRDEKHD